VTAAHQDDVPTTTSPRGFWRRLFAPGPEHIGRYRVLSLIGEGGMGRVYEAEDETLRRRVAVKVLKASDESSAQRFKREAQAAARISHPHVCPIFDWGEDRGQLFIVAERLEGETLAQRLRRGPLSPAEALTLAREILGALQALHESGFVHRDIKPSNVFLTAHGARLLDFGLAREVPRTITDELASQGKITKTGVIVGTVGYMAPEQLLGRAVDGRADLFSTAVLLYEALSGRRPFEGERDVQVLSAVLHEEPPPLDGPPEVAAFDRPIRRALAKPPDRRFASAQEMAQALDAASTPGSTGRAPSTGEAFVGRESELAELEERLAAAIAGNGSVVFVTGERGVGKSMLVSEFLRRVATRGLTVSLAAGRCVEAQGPGQPFHPFNDAIGRLLLSPAKERAAELLRTHAPTVCQMFGTKLVPDPDGTVHLEAVGATKERFVHEGGDFMEAAAREFPTVLYLEDLQWADSASVELLHHLGYRIARHRTLIVGTYRPADVDATNTPMRRCALDLVSRGVGRELAVGPFSVEDVQSYLDRRFSPNSFPPSLAPALYARTEGLALFVRSLVDVLRDRGEIVRHEGEGRLTCPVEELDLEPAKGLLDLVRHHLELLPEQEREILQHASVVGRAFLSVVVAHLVGGSEAEVEEQLRRLNQVRRLIDQGGEEELPDGTLATRYSFAHGLYQSVLYQDLVASRRVEIHRRIAERLQQHWGEEAPSAAAEIARHYERGRDLEGAVTFWLHSADNALQSFASDEAAEHCEWASRLIGKLPTAAQPALRLRLHGKRGKVRHAQARFDEAAEDFRAMLEEARSAGSPESEMAALAGLCDAGFFARRLDDVAAHARELLDAADRAGRDGDATEARARLGQVLVCEGRFAEAVPLLDGVIEAARADAVPVALQLGLTYRGLIHYWQAGYDAAETHMGEAARIAADREAFDFLGTRMFVGLARVKLGRISAGIDEFLAAITLARRNNDSFWLPRLVSQVGWAHREILATERAREFDTEAHRLWRETAPPSTPETEALLVLAIDAVRLGDVDEASALLAELKARPHGGWFQWITELRLAAVTAEHWATCEEWDRTVETADHLLDLARRLGARDYRCGAERWRAEAALARGQDLEAAARRLHEALTGLHRSPAPLESWRAGRVLGLVYRRLGDEEAAHRAHATAATDVHTIAEGIVDTGLREGFLAAPPVREVLDAKTPTGPLP
jgi:tetratricopeptide (TPR) repeat protein